MFFWFASATMPLAIGYAFYDYGAETGLDVLAAEEFPDALRGVVSNLKGMEPSEEGGSSSGSSSSYVCMPCEE